MALKTDLISLGAIGTGAFIAVAATGALLFARSSPNLHDASECMAISVASAPNIAIDLSAARGSGSNAVVIAPRVRVSRNASCAEVASVSEINVDQIRVQVREAREQMEQARERMERDLERAQVDRERLERIRVDLGDDFMTDLTASLEDLAVDLEANELHELDLDAQLEFLNVTLERLTGNNDEVAQRVRDELRRQMEQLQERAEGNGGTGR